MYWNSGDAELCETELSPIEFRKRFPKVRRLTFEEVHSTRRRTHHDQKLRCFRIRQDSCNGVEFRYTRTRVIGVKVRLPASDDSIVSRVSRVIVGSLSLLQLYLSFQEVYSSAYLLQADYGSLVLYNWSV
jgi:hypothetical protein